VTHVSTALSMMSPHFFTFISVPFFLGGIRDDISQRTQ
jgi:hypothetical protein